MANETLITDLVAQEALDQLAALDKAMEDTLSQYTTVAKEMAKGLRIPVEVQGDLDKITNVYNTQMKNAAQATQQMTQLQQQQQQVIANTTNTISRQLAEQEKLNKAQRESYTEQSRALEVAKNILGSHEANVAAMAKYNRELKNLKEAYKDSRISAEEYTRRELELKTAKQELQKILTNEAKMLQSANGSYQQMSLQLERLKMAQKQLNEEEKRGTEGQILEKEIQALDAHLKDLAADMGEFQRNVGNYAIAGKSLRSELKELTMQMAQMLADGVDPTSEAFLEVAERAGRLKDAMADAKDTINDYANDTQMLTQGVSVIETAVGGWQALEGAMSAFGFESEDAARATQKLMGIMSLMNGIQKVSTEITTNGTGAYRAYHAILKLLGLEKAAFTTSTAAEVTAMQAESAAAAETATAQGATAVATEAATVASGAHTAAVGVETAALTGATAAATALKLALAALGIGAVIALIVALYEGVKEFNKEAEKSAEISKGVAEANDDARAAYLKSRGEMEMYVHAIENFNGTKEEEKVLVDELNSKYGDTIGNYESLYQWKNALIDTGLAYIETLEWEAKAQAALNAMIAAEKDGSKEDAEFYRNQYYGYMEAVQKERARLQKLRQERKPAVKTSSKSSRLGKSTRSTATDNGAEDAVEQMQELIDAANDMLDEWQKTATQRAIAITAVVTSTSSEAFTELVEDVKRLYGNLEEQIEENRDKAIAAEQEKYDKAIAEAKKYGKDTTELEQARITALTALDNDYQRQLVDNNANMEATIADMRADRLDLIEEQNEQEIASIVASNAEKANVMRELYLDELRQAEGNEKKIQEVRKRYAKESAELSEQNAIDVANATINGLEQALALEDLTDEEREHIAKELAQAKIDLAKAVGDAEEKQLDRTLKDEQEGRDHRIENLQKWAQKAAEAVSNVSDLFSAMYDAQIEKIEEQMDAEQAHHDAQIAQIDELEEHGVITKEEAELRKREAEARTAKAQEALEKKKAQLQYKSAVMDKANKVAQIAISTALGIMTTFAQLGWPAGIAGAAFVAAMGAIQTATALAQPIKAYKEGTKGKPHPGGLAVVGDGGQAELVMLGRNVWLTPATPTLVDLPRGAQVFPEVTKETIERIGATLPMAIARDKASGQPVIINDYTALEGRVAANTKAMGKYLGRLEKNLTREMKKQSFNAYLKNRL